MQQLAIRDSSMPPNIFIGTRNVFQKGEPFAYIFHEGVQAYICDKTTDNGLPGENLAIVSSTDAGGHWYAATEGVHPGRQFRGSQGRVSHPNGILARWMAGLAGERKGLQATCCAPGRLGHALDNECWDQACAPMSARVETTMC